MLISLLCNDFAKFFTNSTACSPRAASRTWLFKFELATKFCKHHRHNRHLNLVGNLPLHLWYFGNRAF